VLVLLLISHLITLLSEAKSVNIKQNWCASWKTIRSFADCSFTQSRIKLLPLLVEAIEANSAAETESYLKGKWSSRKWNRSLTRTDFLI
jgi:hypothetical protein